MSEPTRVLSTLSSRSLPFRVRNSKNEGIIYPFANDYRCLVEEGITIKHPYASPRYRDMFSDETSKKTYFRG